MRVLVLLLAAIAADTGLARPAPDQKDASQQAPSGPRLRSIVSVNGEDVAAQRRGVPNAPRTPPALEKSDSGDLPTLLAIRDSLDNFSASAAANGLPGRAARASQAPRAEMAARDPCAQRNPHAQDCFPTELQPPHMNPYLT
jgi:hypothetical protein